MIGRNLMLSGLLRQRQLLGELIQELEQKSSYRRDDFEFCHARTTDIAKNLKKLRKMKDNYRLLQRENIS